MPVQSLSERHAKLTQRLILDAAVEVLETQSMSEVSVRAVAKHAGMSERTIFRHFPSRDDLLDALAAEVSRRLDAPADPASLPELLAYPAAIYARFESSAALTKAALHTELYHRIRTTDAQHRGVAIRALVDSLAPDVPARDRRLAAANIHYHVIATTWHYYRFYFGFSLEDAAACARLAIKQALRGLGISV